MSFSSDYVTARDRFRNATARLGWTSQRYALATASNDGEDLTIDIATSAASDTDRVLVISSGLHGVEAAFGSAVQSECLERWAHGSGPPVGLRCVFLHALNPYGFAASRRWDANNVDLNRNFLVQDTEYSGSPEKYPQFDRLLNPRRPPSFGDVFYLRALAAIARHGKPALKQTLAAGQFDFPEGLFFGGTGPSPTMRMLQRYLKAWIGHARTVAHLDFHTGLGPWARCKLILDYTLSAQQEQRLARWFGPGSYEVHSPGGVAYQSRGSLGQWCLAQRLAPDYVFAFAEFGTYGNLPVLAGLRAENQAHHWGRPGDRATVRAKVRLRELFCPASTTWRSRALANGTALVDQAVRGLVDDA